MANTTELESGPAPDADDADGAGRTMVTIRFSPPRTTGPTDGGQRTKSWIGRLPAVQRAALGTTYSVPASTSAAELRALLDAITSDQRGGGGLGADAGDGSEETMGVPVEESGVAPAASDQTPVGGGGGGGSASTSYRFWLRDARTPPAGEEPKSTGGSGGLHVIEVGGQTPSLLAAIKAVNGSLEHTWRVMIEVVAVVRARLSTD